MSLIGERIVIRGLLRALLLEKGIGDTSMESIVDRMSEYDAAKAEYERWLAERQKFEKAAELARSHGIDVDNASAMLRLRRKYPEYDYDPKLLKKEKQVKDRLAAAWKATQPEYNVEIGPAPFEMPAEDRPAPGSHVAARKKAPSSEKPVFMSPKDMQPLQTYLWTDFNHIGLPPMGGFEDGSGGSAGMHPGEDRIAKIIGGERQGDTVPFDIVDSEGMTWEVKGLPKPTSLIRPGAHGVTGAREATNALLKVMNEINEFVNRVEEGGAAVVCDTNEQMNRYIAVRKFIKREQHDIFRNEISAARFEALTLALENISRLRKMWSYESIRTLTGKLTHGDRDLDVPRLKLIKILRALADDDPSSRELLSTYSPRELALAELETREAYDSPWDWMNAWGEKIDVEKIFDVDGMFIVTPKGFNMVPRSMFRDVLELRKMSQDRPKYAFVPGGAKR